MPPRKAIRSDGRYQVSASITDDKTGKRVRKYFYRDVQTTMKIYTYIDGADISNAAVKLDRYLQ